MNSGDVFSSLSKEETSGSSSISSYFSQIVIDKEIALKVFKNY